MCGVRAWQRDRCASFVPPDGPFRLFTYRVRRIAALPLYVNPQISFGPAAHVMLPLYWSTG